MHNFAFVVLGLCMYCKSMNWQSNAIFMICRAPIFLLTLLWIWALGAKKAKIELSSLNLVIKGLEDFLRSFCQVSFNILTQHMVTLKHGSSQDIKRQLKRPHKVFHREKAFLKNSDFFTLLFSLFFYQLPSRVQRQTSWFSAKQTQLKVKTHSSAVSNVSQVQIF